MNCKSYKDHKKEKERKMKNGEKIYHSVYIKNVIQVMKFCTCSWKREKNHSLLEKEREDKYLMDLF